MGRPMTRRKGRSVFIGVVVVPVLLLVTVNLASGSVFAGGTAMPGIGTPALGNAGSIETSGPCTSTTSTSTTSSTTVPCSTTTTTTTTSTTTTTVPVTTTTTATPPYSPPTTTSSVTPVTAAASASAAPGNDTPALAFTGPTAGSPPPTTQPPSPGVACQQATDQSFTNDLAYQPRKKMTEGVPTRITVVLGNGRLPADSIPGPEPTVIIRVKTTCQVEVQLIGTAFVIAPSGWQTEAFGDPTRNTNAPLTWTWEVTPQAAGHDDLELQIKSDWQQTSGVTLQGALDNYFANILVTSDPVPWYHPVWDFLNTPLFVLLVTLAVGGGGVATLLDRRRRHHQPLKLDPPPPDAAA